MLFNQLKYSRYRFAPKRHRVACAPIDGMVSVESCFDVGCRSCLAVVVKGGAFMVLVPFYYKPCAPHLGDLNSLQILAPAASGWFQSGLNG